MLNVGVIGLGDISYVHIPIILNNIKVKLIAVCDIDETRKDEFLQNGIKFYTDYKLMLKENKLDCVHICLPHNLHKDAAIESVNAGANVFLEKPLANSLEESQKILELEKANNNIKINVCLQNRYNQTFLKLQQILKENKYGNILGVKGIVTWARANDYYSSKPWRGIFSKAGGGTMINQSIHTLDLMQLIGGEIKSIKGVTTNFLDYDIDVEDTAVAHIEYSNGATGMFFSTVAYKGNSSVELQVLCESAKLTIKNNILTITKDNKTDVLIEDDKCNIAKSYYGASHKVIIDNFYDSIINDTDDYVNAKEGIASMIMIDAINKSSSINKKIELEEYFNEKRSNRCTVNDVKGKN